MTILAALNTLVHDLPPSQGHADFLHTGVFVSQNVCFAALADQSVPLAGPELPIFILGRFREDTTTFLSHLAILTRPDAN